MKLPLATIILAGLSFAADGSATAQVSKHQLCPTISVSCPDIPSKDKPLSYKAEVGGGDPSVMATFHWSTSRGKIIGGQGTAEITVDAEGHDSLTVTVEVGGYPATCPAAASCSWFICPPPSARKLSEFGGLSSSDEKARLDDLAIELRNDPTAQGYIIAYSGRRERAGVAVARAERAKKYLVERHGLERERVVAVGGGPRVRQESELWVVPAGASPPQATPITGPQTKHNNGLRPTSHHGVSHAC